MRDVMKESITGFVRGAACQTRRCSCRVNCVAIEGVDASASVQVTNLGDVCDVVSPKASRTYNMTATVGWMVRLRTRARR